MIKIGFVDICLDNWHANHYPEYIREAAKIYGIPADLSWAYGERDSSLKWGLSRKAWCQNNGCNLAESYDELIEKSDAIMVIAADDCSDHERLAEKALRSGKRVYCDKTFAPSLEAAERMFKLADDFGTKVFSCSAQRFCPDIISYKKQNMATSFATSLGPGDLINYSIHQFEMLEAVMGRGFASCKGFMKGETRHLVYEYDDGRMCTFTQAKSLPFRLFAGSEETGIKELKVENYYMEFMGALLRFFDGGVLPVEPEDTLEIMKMQQAARKALY